ncbi:ATP-binding protease [Rhodococcus wratislaviensis IFP 2016]|nr:ATP-binding protease [Rhodococcus wratislaviensis IFP 2016]
MFEKFTEQARRAVVLASDAARTHHHDYLGTEHLLLGVLEADGVAATSLTSCPPTSSAASSPTSAHACPTRPGTSPSPHTPRRCSNRVCTKHRCSATMASAPNTSCSLSSTTGHRPVHRSSTKPGPRVWTGCGNTFFVRSPKTAANPLGRARPTSPPCG